ncbi:MAG TPA: hypothetical protein VF846_17820 [Thermoanaerobaculia bacterium]|jgi:hypothetical protein
MKRTFIAALALAALPLFANAPLFSRYENVRQAFLKNSLKDVQSSAAAFAADARKAKLPTVAKEADAVAKSADLAKARVAFAAVSESMIKLQSATKGARPAVYACPMIKKSWLQPKGQVGNPYDASMPMCGTLKAE